MMPTCGKKQVAATEWCRKINTLPPPDRMERQWEYVLLGETVFYSPLRPMGLLSGRFAKPEPRVLLGSTRGTVLMPGCMERFSRRWRRRAQCIIVQVGIAFQISV